MKLMPTIVVALLCVYHVAGQSEPGFAVNFVVPSSSSNLDGNTYSFRGPAAHYDNTRRYQQVYAASEFAYLTNSGGGWLFDIVFRGDATNGEPNRLTMPSVQVNLSTTQRDPDALNAVFSDNVGPDDTVVRSGCLDTTLEGSHSGGPPRSWTFSIGFSRMFHYNPAAGNLLLDFRVFQGNTSANAMIPIVFDAVNITNDSVSRVVADLVGFGRSRGLLSTDFQNAAVTHDIYSMNLN